MIQKIYRVQAHVEPSSPLHWSNFWQKKRIHRESMEERQSLVLWLAKLHHDISFSNIPSCLNYVDISLSSLRQWVRDYREAFDVFFSVTSTGYNLGNDDKEISTVIPNKLCSLLVHEIKRIVNKLKFVLPEKPTTDIWSTVEIRTENKDQIINFIEDSKRFDLLPAVYFLLDFKELQFAFERAGKLQLRDTSTYPIKAIESWPSKLRTLIFGPGIDMEAAYIQFVISKLKEVYEQKTIKMLFPNLVMLLNDKFNIRNYLMSLMGPNATLSLVKEILMALANGAKISTKLFDKKNRYSSVVSLILDSKVDTPTELLQNLEAISDEFNNAKKILSLKNKSSTKDIFKDYFSWEREMRYKIWESSGRRGIMVHDGIDGIPPIEIEGLMLSSK